MGHVFLLVFLLGEQKQPNPMYFASINTCNWYASRIVRRYGNYGSSNGMIPPEHRATAYCKPVFVNKDNILVYDH